MPEGSGFSVDDDSSYAELLEWHLRTHGTRPDGSPERQGKLWQYGTFADTAGISVRSLQKYRAGSRPSAEEQNKIEAALFGSNPEYDAWKRRLRSARIPLPTGLPDALPRQGAGPHYGIDASGRIAKVPASAIDPHGNDARRIRQLLPLVRQAAEDLAAALQRGGNSFPELIRDLTAYRQALSLEQADISWGEVWGLGVLLEEAAIAAERKIDDRMAPTLEDLPLGTLQALRKLHAPLILATADGREFQEQADLTRMTREEQALLRTEATAFAARLEKAKEIIVPDAAASVTAAVSGIGAGRHPERGTTFGIATLKHLSIVLVGAAFVAAPAHYGGVVGTAVTMGVWQSLQKAPAFAAAVTALGEEFHRAMQAGGAAIQQQLMRLSPFRGFVMANEAPLRQMAAGTAQLRWILSYMDFLAQTHQPPTPGPMPSVPDVQAGGRITCTLTAPRTDEVGAYADLIVRVRGEVPVTQRLRWIPPGEYLRGSPPDEDGRFDDEGPQRPVTIAQGFWLFDTPCTQALWQAVMGDNPSEFKTPTRPVERVSFADVQKFLSTLNKLLPGLNLSLPSEAQWEYACRAGTVTATYAGPNTRKVLDTIAWYAENSEKRTQPVARKLANDLGLYDMLGNVYEWCADHWHSSYDDAPDDERPWLDIGPDAGAANRVLRGGSWLSVARVVRSASRNHDDPANRNGRIGFRCARVQVPSEAPAGAEGREEQARSAERRAATTSPERAGKAEAVKPPGQRR